MNAVRELVARFSADRDAVLSALDQCRSQVTRLSGRLAMEQARVDEIEQLRSELAQASRIAERAAVDVDALSCRVEDTTSVDALRHDLEAVSSRLDDTGPIEALRRQLRDELREQLQTQLVQTRDVARRALDETRAHLEVRLDSLAAGLEAQVGAVRDGLWDRVAELQQRVQASEQTLGGRTASIEGSVTVVRDQVATVRSEIHGLATRLERMSSARDAQPSGVIGWLWQELAGLVGGLAAVTWWVGRQAVGTSTSPSE